MSLAKVAEKTQDQEIAEGALTLYEQSKSITILTTEDYSYAGEFLLSLKDQEKRIKEWFYPLKKKADEAHKALTAKEKETLKPLVDARSMVEPKMLSWKREQDRIAEEQARRLAEMARKEAEERALMEALAAEKDGDTEAAQAIIEEPIEAPVIRVESAAPKISGLAERKTWSYEIVNLALLPKEYMMPDTVKIGGIVRAMKGNTKIPGIKVFEVSSLAGSRR